MLKLLKRHLSRAKLMQLSTCKNNKPWTCTVFFACDSDFNIYFISGGARRHSLELKENPYVSGAIVVSKKEAGKSGQVGVQFEGNARIASSKEYGKAARIFLKRFPLVKSHMAQGNKGAAKLYKIAPSKFVIYDEVAFPENSRRELTKF